MENVAATQPTPAVKITRMQSSEADLGCTRIAVDGAVYNRYVGSRNPGPNPSAVHTWEKCGLGVAPYKLVGSGTATYQACPGAPVQPGASCDYCGQAITNVYSIQAACKSVFKVGCDCARKVCAKGEGVLSAVEVADKQHRNALTKVARERKDATTVAALAELRTANLERLAAPAAP